MAFDVIAKASAIWAAILLCAILNGALREAVLIPKLGSVPGLVLSGLLLSFVILAVTYLSLPWLGIHNDRGLWAVGIGWLIATLIFELIFGLSRGKPVAEILGAYTFKGGNLWPVVLVVTAAAPWLAARFRGWLARADWP